MSEAAVEGRIAPFGADLAGTTRAFVRAPFRDRARPDLVDRVSNAVAAAPPRIAGPLLRATWTHGRLVFNALLARAIELLAGGRTGT